MRFHDAGTPRKSENHAQNAQSAFVLAPGLNLQPRLAKSGPAHFSTGFLLFMSKNVQSGPAPAKLNATPRKTVHKKNAQNWLCSSKTPQMASFIQESSPPGASPLGQKPCTKRPVAFPARSQPSTPA